MWQWVIDFISHPATEAGIHLMVLAIFVMEVWQHWTHHRKNKRSRGATKYTLDEAKVILFETVALSDPKVFVMPKKLEFKSE